ncbi:hypothetical protein [Acinetobacter baylyi]|uniref:hypothetical protein n=1 Tax=Acinetobacter baylyi TaxID=202950 RepID=UPI0031D45886
MTEDQGLPQATDKAITETTAYFAYLRKAALESNLFDLASNKTVDLFYSIESYELDRASEILDNVEKLKVRYQVKTSDGKILFDQVVESVGVYDFASNKESKSWRANTQKFLVLLRTRWDNNFLFTGEKLWQAADTDALNPNRTVSSSILTGAGATVLAVGSVVVAGGAVVKGTLSAAGDVLSDPAFSAALQQQTANMQREQDRQRKRDIEAKAYSARMAEERRRTTPKPSYTSATTSSSSSAFSTLSSSSTSTTSSVGNTNTGVINKKTKTEREQNLKAQEQKKSEQQKAYDEKIAKAQQERDEQESLREKQLAEQQKKREIQLANEKREREKQAEKERKERERLAQKQQEEQAKNNYLANVQRSLRLKAVSCYGNNYPLGTIPKGLGSSNHVSGINVHYRAYCPGGGSYNGISKNFVGMGGDCFTGDTTGNEIPKSVLSCKAEDMTVEVTDVRPTR